MSCGILECGLTESDSENVESPFGTMYYTNAAESPSALPTHGLKALVNAAHVDCLGLQIPRYDRGL